MPSPEDPLCSTDASCSLLLSSGSLDSPSRRARASRPSARTRSRPVAVRAAVERAAGPHQRSRIGPAGCGSSTATSRSTGMSAAARCGSRSRASTRRFCTRPGSPPVWAPTTSVSIADRKAAGASCSSSASGRRSCSSSPINPSDRAARMCSSASPLKIRSRSRSCGARRSRPSRATGCSSTPRRFSCAT